MIEVVIEEMHGSDRNSRPETITSEPWLVWQLIPTRAKWRSSPSACCSVLGKVLDSVSIVREAMFQPLGLFTTAEGVM